MLRHWLQKTIQTFNGALQINLKRFPITLFFILSLTCYLCYLVAADQPENKKLYWILGYYLSVGTLLSLSLHLWCEEIKRSKSPSNLGMHRAQRERNARNIALYYCEKQKKYAGSFGVEEIQPHFEKSYST
jgi:hypothetical protein